MAPVILLMIMVIVNSLWIFKLWNGGASRYRRVYHPDNPSTQPSTSISAAAALPKICYLSLHKAKGFTDDLTVISNDVKLHQWILSSLVLKPIDICLEFQPLKYSEGVSLVKCMCGTVTDSILL